MPVSGKSPRASASTRPSGSSAASLSIRNRSRWRASFMSPRTKRTNRRRSPAGKTGSHVLAYADKTGGTEENALFGTPDEICAMLEALQDGGVDYVLLTVSGGNAQLRRFAREIMPVFARSVPAAHVAE